MNNICHFKTPWHDNWANKDFTSAIVCKVVEDAPGKWTMLLNIRGQNEEGKNLLLSYNVRVNPFSPVHSGLREQPESWGMEQLGPGVWALEPSVVIPGVIHAFITIVNVPEPSPWSNK